MARVATGIEGFDELVDGGLVPSSAVIVRGKPGTGKTLFCSQFLYTGATKYQEPGIYVTLEELAEDIKQDIKETFGWDLDNLEKKNLLFWLPLRIKRVVHPIEKKLVVTMDVAEIIKKIVNLVVKTKAKRLVIDSVSIIDMMFEDKFMVRSELIGLLDELKKINVTVLLCSEISEVEGIEAGSGFVDFMGDMVIKLDRMFIGQEFRRTLLIKKMRRSKHSTFIHPFEITSSGLKVSKVDKK